MNFDRHPSAVHGQAIGVMILATGGMVWLLFALRGMHGGLLVLLPYAVLIAAAWMLRSRATRLGIKPPPEEESAGRDKVLVIATIAEGVAIFAALIGTQLAGHAEWIPPLIALIIGLHFLPLARAFRRPLLNAAAAGLYLVAIFVPLLLPLHRALSISGAFHSPWMLWCGIGSAAVLWATSAAQLLLAQSNLRQVSADT